MPNVDDYKLILAGRYWLEVMHSSLCFLLLGLQFSNSYAEQKGLKIDWAADNTPKKENVDLS